MRIFHSLLVAASLLMSTPSYALFDAQLLIGSRSGDVDDSEFNSSDFTLAAHVDPIPLVPVAFGVYLNQTTWDVNAADHGFSEGTGLEAGLQVYAWLPIGIAGLKPYAKLGLPIYSAHKFDGSMELLGESVDYSTVAQTSGTHLSFGASWSPVPLLPVAVLLEVDVGSQKFETIEATAGGSDLDDALTTSDYSSTSFLVGVQAGL